MSVILLPRMAPGGIRVVLLLAVIVLITTNVNAVIVGDAAYSDLVSNDVGSGLPLVRHRREADNSTGDTSIWEDIEIFYSDKNNMAMYCVLPIMVLVYGGCSAIYCVHRCRQYMKRMKHKRLKEEDTDSLNDEKNDLNIEDKEQGRPVSQISSAWTDLQAEGGGAKWSGQTDPGPIKSPLPWQTNAAAATALSYEREKSNLSRADYLEDKLQNDSVRPSSQTGNRSDSLEDSLDNDGAITTRNIQVVAAATTSSTSTDDDNDNPLPQRPPARLPPIMPVRPHEDSRIAHNLTDYTAKTSAVKAMDSSRFSDSKPIEIIPLSADPNLRMWDPLHKRPFGDTSRQPIQVTPLGGYSDGRVSVQEMKEDMLARYDALSTFQMAKKAAEILKTNAVEKSPFVRKPNKKKHIFIAE